MPVSLRALCLYFLRLGASGFGGPIALAGYMQRDLQEQRGWITAEEYQDGLALAQTMPGPLAAQLAMWIGYIRGGVLGATLVGVLFVLPPFVLVVAVAALYVHFSGITQIHDLFYGIGPATIAIIALAAWRLARSTDRADVKLWLISGALLAVTVVTGAELAWLFIVAGFGGVLIYGVPEHRRLRDVPPAPPAPQTPPAMIVLPAVPHLSIGPISAAVAAVSGSTLVLLTFFFLKASAFTFGSGLAIVPFLHQGVVSEHHWVDERQFLDAVAMGIITPGPVVIMAAFIGYLAAGLPGALLAAFGVFAPVWLIDVVVGPLFLRHRRQPHVRGFVKGATAAAVGAIGGAAVVLGRGAVHDPVTWAIFIAAFLVLRLRRVPDPYVVAVAGLAGLLLAPGV